MPNYTDINLRNDVAYELRDRDHTTFQDTLLSVFLNDALIFVKEEIRRQNLYGTCPEEFPLVILDKDQFSSDNRIAMPCMYMDYITMRHVGASLPIRMTNLGRIDDDVTQARGTIYATSVGPPVPGQTTGVDDLVSMEGSDGYNGTADDTITITIASASTFNWASTYCGSGAGVAITADTWQLLANRIYVKFETSSQTVGNTWTILVRRTEKIMVLWLNYAPSSDIEAYIMRKHTPITLTGEAFTGLYLPFYRYYLAIKQYVLLRCRNHAEESIGQDEKIIAPVAALITRIASGAHRDVGSSMMPEAYNPHNVI